MAAKQRLDLRLVGEGWAESREKARGLIMAGRVLVAGRKVDKPGTMVDESCGIELLGGGLAYVSRGGLKLEGAIRAFGLNLEGMAVLDIGASTGGFTDCALQHGAARVIAVDVGYGQLAWKLRQDPRVTSMEKTNARYLRLADIGARVDCACIDVAFISLTKVLPAVAPLVRQEGLVIALVKPQFEAGPERVGKKGVVRDPAVHREVLRRVLTFAAELGWPAKKLAVSPIKGPEGNVEFLALLTEGAPGIGLDVIESLVTQAASL